MDLPSTLNAPRIVYLAGQAHFVRAISMEGMAIILAWLDDILPSRNEREMPPRFADEASQAALNAPSGQVLLIWLALRHEGVTFDQAARIDASDLERARLNAVLFHRRRSLQASPTSADVGETWCGKGLASMVSQIGMERLAALSLDQFEWLCSDGECDMHADPDVKNRLAWQEQWNKDNAAWKTTQPPETTEATPDYVIAPGNGEVKNG
jgi:hypothetical protein